MYIIKKSFSFSASHELRGLPTTHPCSRVHGHNYVVTVELQATKLSPVGFVTDYRELQPIKEYIDTELDHRHLNDVMADNPTAENIARMIFIRFKKMFPQLAQVTVSETEKTSASYNPSYNE